MHTLKDKLYPNPKIKSVAYIKNLPPKPNVEIGDYTYYSNNNNSPEDFYTRIQHHYEWLGDKLIIGKFCAIAQGITFIMNGANHNLEGISTYPFNIFTAEWAGIIPTKQDTHFKGDTIVGNDIWIGQNVTIMPGINIGHGAIIAAYSVVCKNVEPYTVIGGNPARVIRKRFDNKVIVQLLEMAWWDWDIEKITKNLDKLTNIK